MLEEPDGVLVEVLLQRGIELLLVVGASEHRVEREDGLSAASKTALWASRSALPTGLKLHIVVLLTTISEKAGNGLFTLLNYSSLMRILSRNIEGPA